MRVSVVMKKRAVLKGEGMENDMSIMLAEALVE